jgi:hypothetical protein
MCIIGLLRVILEPLFFGPRRTPTDRERWFRLLSNSPLCAKAVGGISCRRPQRADSGRPSFRSATPRSGGHASFASARLRSERIKNILLVDSARAVLHYREGAGWYAWVSSGRLRTLRELGSSQARMTRTVNRRGSDPSSPKQINALRRRSASRPHAVSQCGAPPQSPARHAIQRNSGNVSRRMLGYM